jgi:hypothetical protein
MQKKLFQIRSPWRRLAVGLALSALVLAGRAYKSMQRARPRRLILPATLAQIVWFLISMLLFPERGLYIFAAGIFLIIGAALYPSTLPRPAHWVGRPELSEQ